MKIIVRDRFAAVKPQPGDYPLIVLGRDNWNDHGYYTTFSVELRVSSGHTIDLHHIRIMTDNQQEGFENRPFEHVASGTFVPDDLLGSICSLAPSEEYYDALRTVENDLGIEVLATLRDASYIPEVREHFQSQQCFKVSLLRDSSSRELLDSAGLRFGTRRAFIDRFKVGILLSGASASHAFDFDFGEQGGVPHRIHSIVGLNGVGKTQVMARLAMLLSRFSKEAIHFNRSTLQSEDTVDPVPSIYTVVAVSFSAFDEFDRPTEDEGNEFKYSYCGLQTEDGRLKSKDDLLADIYAMISRKMSDEKRVLLKVALSNLVRVDSIDAFVDDPERHAALYERLSAGQRLALNCICHILARITPRTLVLFDEPELHLHPQLLTGLMSALSEILRGQDSFAIVATHSPLVVQQLPKECVHVLRRDRSKPMVVKPTFQTFGESLSEITRFVFASTENERDYRQVLESMLAERNGSVNAVREAFGGKLSLNADIYLESLRARGEASE
jgi:ABC-type lipoprotein export system ATPase subunit